MRRALPSSLLAALVLAGCVAQPQRVGGAPRREAPPTVVSLSPSTTEIMASNYGSLLVGRTAADNYPQNVASTPVVAETKPDLEKIKTTKAGMVVYDADLYNEADVQKIESLGLKTFAFKAHTVEGFERELWNLSAELGGETTINDFVTRIERARAEAEADKLPNKPKVAVVLGGGYVAGTDSFVADVVRIAGGEPVGPPTGKFDPMSPEALVAAAPDVIVLPTSKANGAKDLAALKANPALAATPALRANRVVALDGDIVLRRGVRVEQLIRGMHSQLALALQK